jgi:glycosyltransferase 2 family protein
MNRVPWRPVVGVAVAAACLAWLFHDVSIASVLRGLHGVHWSWVVAAIVAQLASYGLQGARWRLLLRPVGRISWLRATEAIYAGLFTNEIMPARPGELLRAYIVSCALGARLRTVLGSIVVERIFDGTWVCAALLLTIATAPLPAMFLQIGLAFVAIFLIVTLTVVLMARRSSTAAFGATVRQSVLNGGGGSAFVISAFFFLGQVLAFWLVMRGYGIHRGLLTALGTAVVIQLGTAIPNAPANVGTYQLACVAGLEMFGIDKATATGFSVVVFIVLTAPVWLLGAIALARSATHLENEWGNSAWSSAIALTHTALLHARHGDIAPRQR